MTRIVIKKLVWDEFNLKHATMHGLSLDEINEAVKQVEYHKHSYGYRYVVVCKVREKIVSIVVSRKSLNTYYVVSARIASKLERKLI